MHWLQDKIYYAYVQYYSVFYNNAARLLYVRIDILLTREKQLHDRTISLRGEVWDHKTILTSPLYIEVPVPRQESQRSYIFIRGMTVSILSLNDFDVWFWNCSDIVGFVPILSYYFKLLFLKWYWTNKHVLVADVCC